MKIVLLSTGLGVIAATIGSFIQYYLTRRREIQLRHVDLRQKAYVEVCIALNTFVWQQLQNAEFSPEEALRVLRAHPKVQEKEGVYTVPSLEEKRMSVRLEEADKALVAATLLAGPKLRKELESASRLIKELCSILKTQGCSKNQMLTRLLSLQESRNKILLYSRKELAIDK